MSCTKPMLSRVNKDGKVKFINQMIDTYKLKNGYFLLPCGQCGQCRLANAREWAIRSTHEAQLYDDNCFISLTYADEHLPPLRSLCHEHFQLFAKRLRKHFQGICPVLRPNRNTGVEELTFPIRIMMCGEYGEENCRPHYHACIYNFDFPDKEPFFKSNGYTVYRSAILEELWPYGISSIGSLTFESASYVARYCLKKRTGKEAEWFYHGRTPDYGQFPRGYGLGAEWIKKFWTDVYPHSYCVIRRGEDSYTVKPPRYYDNFLEKINPDMFQEVKRQRQEVVLDQSENFSYEKLDVKEKLYDKRLKQLVRKLELN